MKHIVYVWEMGQGLGHLMGFLPLALELRRRGHRVTFVMKDLSRAEQFLTPHNFEFFQAPIWLPKAVGIPGAVTFSDILLKFGFLDFKGITSLCRAWRSLLAVIKPDLLILDHAPTALLATTGLGIPRALIGTGYFSPPHTKPLPPLMWWQKIPNEQLVQSEQRILNVVNQTLTELSHPSFNALHELFHVEEDFICTFSELEHYQGRSETEYWGPRFSLDEGMAPSWPMGEEKRVFAYLNPHYQHFDLLMQTLNSLPVCVLVVGLGASRQQIVKYQSPRIHLVNSVVNVNKVGQECDLAINHGGHGTASAMLLAGKPLLVLPNHVEQLIMAKNIEKLNLGRYVEIKAKKPNFKSMLKCLIFEEKFSDNAKLFAEKYQEFDHEKQILLMANRSVELMH